MSLTSTGDKEVIFVYSEMQIEEEKKINKKVRRGFTCGEVAIGSQRKQFSKIILPNQLSHMTSLYPDTKIIYQGKLKEVSYVPIKNDFLK